MTIDERLEVLVGGIVLGFHDNYDPTMGIITNVNRRYEEVRRAPSYAKVGLRFELESLIVLSKLGLKILKYSDRGWWGEIDAVALKDGTYYIFEIKHRNFSEFNIETFKAFYMFLSRDLPDVVRKIRNYAVEKNISRYRFILVLNRRFYEFLMRIPKPPKKKIPKVVKNSIKYIKSRRIKKEILRRWRIVYDWREYMKEIGVFEVWIVDDKNYPYLYRKISLG